MSTVVELGGFGCLTYAAWRFQESLGLLVAGLCLLLIGYAVEGTSLHLRANVVRLRAKMTQRKVIRAARKEG